MVKHLITFGLTLFVFAIFAAIAYFPSLLLFFLIALIFGLVYLLIYSFVFL